MKLKNDSIIAIIFLLLLFLSLKMNAITFVIGSISIIVIIFMTSSQINNTKMKLSFYIFMFVIIAFILVQIAYLELNLSMIKKLIWVDVIMYSGLIMLLLFKREFLNAEKSITMINFMLILLNIATVFLTKGLSYMRVGLVTGTSINYPAAISCVIIPCNIYFVLKFKFNNKVNKGLCYLALISSIAIIIYSGSRILMVMLLFQLISLFLINSKSIKTVVVLLLTGILVYLLMFYLLPKFFDVDIHNMINRATNISSFNEDSFREQLRNVAIEKIKFNNILLGCGSIYVYEGVEVHNFILEMLLSNGLIGIFAYAVYAIGIITAVLKEKNGTGLYVCVSIITFYSIGLLHPFVTTGFTYNIIYWSGVFILSKVKTQIDVRQPNLSM